MPTRRQDGWPANSARPSSQDEDAMPLSDEHRAAQAAKNRAYAEALHSTPMRAAQPEAAPSGMVEAMARAICRVAGFDPDQQMAGPASQWEWFGEEARAALVAMREPTDTMLRAAGLYNRTRARENWQAMIDAALEEGA